MGKEETKWEQRLAGKNVLTAEQVKKLPPGSRIIRYSRDMHGTITSMEATVVKSGKKKMLAFDEWQRVIEITAESDRIRYSSR